MFADQESVILKYSVNVPHCQILLELEWKLDYQQVFYVGQAIPAEIVVKKVNFQTGRTPIDLEYEVNLLSSSFTLQGLKRWSFVFSVINYLDL